MTVSHIFFGRIAGISFGYTMGLGHFPVVSINILIETFLVMLFYPLFVFGLRKLVVFPSLGKLMDRTHRAAETHREKIERYGYIGLFLFVWFPFWMTGPLVGCTIGFILGMNPWTNLSVVLGGTYMAVCTYSLLLKGVYDRVQQWGPWAAIIILSIIMVIFGGVHLIFTRQK